MSVNLDARVVSLVQVDAEAVGEGFVPQVNLDELFRMSELFGIVTGVGTVEFRHPEDYYTWLTLSFTAEGVDVSAGCGTGLYDGTAWTLTAFAEYDLGKGTADDPYRIYTAGQLNAIGTDPNLWASHFDLVADVDFGAYTPTEFNIIGNTHTPFSGTFDGHGHTISNFTFDDPRRNCIGLFGVVAGSAARVKNLGLIAPSIAAVGDEGDNVGSLVGVLERGLVSDCYARGVRVSGSSQVGGLVGQNRGVIRRCFVTGLVSGDWYVGGMVGRCGDYATRRSFTSGSTAGVGEAHVTDCYAVGIVRGYDEVGGLIGKGGWRSTAANCYAAGVVACRNVAGGLIGAGDANDVTASFWDSQISRGMESAGGEPKATAEMQTAAVFLEAGWDFAGEMENGADDIWWMPEGPGYPRLWWERSVAEVAR